jgi:uncharacterized membrane protein
MDSLKQVFSVLVAIILVGLAFGFFIIATTVGAFLIPLVIIVMLVAYAIYESVGGEHAKGDKDKK